MIVVLPVIDICIYLCCRVYLLTMEWYFY